MCRKLVYMVSFVLLLSVAGNAYAELVGYWKFDEGSGTIAYDSSGNGNDGTFVGDPQWVAGHFGSALEFDRDGDYLDCGNDTSLQISGEVSITAWIQVGAQGIDHKVGGNQDGANGGYKMSVVNDKVEFEIRTSANAAVLNRDVAGGTILEIGVWYHVAGIYSQADGYIRTYVNGVLDRELLTTQALGVSPGNLYIGCEPYDTGNTGFHFNGVMDDIRLYDHALTENEILAAMEGLEGYPYASKPVPDDGTTYASTWVSLGWQPGDFAVSHNVYMGDNFDDVNAGTGGTFLGNTTDTYFIAGFLGFPLPEGLIPETTYYWRIDEVNDLHPDSPWKGKIWSFWVAPKKAYEPNPSDGAKFIDPDVTLTWTPGPGTKVHYVYFGEDFDTVNNATGGTSQGPATYKPGTLEREKTYYWRVDESDGFTTYKGDVWSFTIAKEGGGLRGEYYHWWPERAGEPPPQDPVFRTFVLTRIDPQINWNWGDPGSPDPAVDVDGFACKWTGEIEAAFTETYTFYMTTDDGQRLWIDGQLIIDRWIQQGMTEWSGTIDLVAGQKYSIEAWMYEHGGGAGAELRWSSLHTPKQIIPQAAFSPPVRASNPNPPDGATGVKMTPTLSWDAGDYAVSHEVYFGTDADAVKNATTTSPEYKGTRALGDESYEPGKLAWDTAYYWRIDEVNNLHPDSPWIGNLWSFTTGDFLVIDNFEDYDAGENQIWYAWRDGLGFGAIGVPPYSPGNGTGSAVGDENTDSYTEENIVHSGDQSMPYWFDNNKPDKMKYSEAKLTLTAPRDWTEEQVKALSLWFQGYPASVGSFIESPAGTYTMTASGYDIWTNADGVEADEFHFAYKMLNGQGTIIARVDSVQNTDAWAKAGVMIRETLDPNSAHAFACMTPANGVAAQGRPSTGGTSFNTNQTGITAPHWVRLERDLSGNFTVSHSANGSTWEPVQGATPQNIPMSASVYVGLALTANNPAATCTAVFSNVTISGNVSPQWLHQDIGIQSNDPEPMYVAVANNTGPPAVVYHDDPNAAQIDTWTEWNIDLKEFSDKGIVLTDVNSIAIGFGNRNNPQAGGAGKMYFDDIRLYRPRYVPGLGTPLAADVNSDGVVDFRDLEIMSDNWLDVAAAPNAANMVAQYEFENNTNDSAGANHGTAYGTPSYAAGQVGQAIDLDGIDDYIDCGSDASLNITEAVTVTAWIRLSGPATDQKIVGNQDNSTGGYKFGINNNRVEFEIRTSGNSAVLNRSVSGGTVLTAGVWYHVVGVYSQGSYIRTYVNGILDRELVTTGVLGATSGTLKIGREPFTDLFFFNGLIDDLRIYNYALSSSEVFYVAGGSPVDLNDDMKIDLKDYAALAEQWLEEQLWPE